MATSSSSSPSSLSTLSCVPRANPNQQSLMPYGETIIDHVDFNAAKDCKVLMNSMKGLGTNEAQIIKIVSHRSNAQRQALKETYQNEYGKDLIKELKSELGGNFEDAILALFIKSDEFEARMLHDAMKGAGTDDSALVEVMCSRNNNEIHAIAETYQRIYQTDLTTDIQSDTSGDFQTILLNLAKANRPVGARGCFGFIDYFRARREARQLFVAGEQNKFGTDESRFHQILTQRSFEYLDFVRRQYTSFSNVTLEDAIKRELSGNFEKSSLAILKCGTSRLEYFADVLYNAMKGIGTNNKALIRILVSRSEVDLAHIKKIFKKKYKTNLARFIQEDCSGDFKKLLVQIVKGNNKIELFSNKI